MFESFKQNHKKKTPKKNLHKNSFFLAFSTNQTLYVLWISEHFQSATSPNTWKSMFSPKCFLIKHFNQQWILMCTWSKFTQWCRVTIWANIGTHFLSPWTCSLTIMSPLFLRLRDILYGILHLVLPPTSPSIYLTYCSELYISVHLHKFPSTPYVKIQIF